MEHFRNEPVYLVVTSYVIGFVTAYIAFGVSETQSNYTAIEFPVEKPAVVQTAEAAPVQLSATERGLEFNNAGDRLILTANAQYFDHELNEPEPNYHHKIVKFELSPDESMVYFCDVPHASVDYCRPSLFVIADDTVYPLYADGTRLELEAVPHDVEWNKQGVASVAGIAVDLR